MGAKIAGHNTKVLKNSNEKTANKNKKPKCNCQKEKVQDCPIPGACKQFGVIYQASVSNNLGKVETYIGLAENFKKRFYKHKKSLEYNSPNNSTTLSAYFWKEKDAGKSPKVSWKILENNLSAFNPTTEKCQLCTREKIYIVLKPHLCTLNSRLELFSHCKHIESKLMMRAPD